MTDDATPAARIIRLIGAPTDVGAGHRGASMAPEALRVAGLAAALERLGHRVEDGGNLSGPANPDHAQGKGFRHCSEVEAWCRTVHDAVHDALETKRLPILMGGDHSLSVGSVAAVARHCADRGKPLSVLWLDAHADFNTGETTVSGNLHGTPVAALTGRGVDSLAGLGRSKPIIEPGRIVQLGVRSIDVNEKVLVTRSGIQVIDMRRIDEIGMRRAMDEALERLTADGAHLHVSLDVDFLDPDIAPGVGTTVAGGPTYREAQLAMEMIHDSGRMGSLDIMELNPALDHGNRTAELLVELVESLFGEQILSRHQASI